MTKLYEADLYEPIRKHFIKLGYRVNGEVHDCDLTAVKDDNLIIVELKLTLNIDLLLQATRRQRLTDLVYIAIPKPKRITRKRWNDITQLIQRLELGLIIVSFAGNRKKVEFKIHPEPYKRMASKNTRKKAALIKEIEGRSADYNIGGSSKTKIMTAYKENCIQIACYLEKLGQLSPKALVALGTGNKTPLILQKNYYKWFERVERGIYVITEQGRSELKDYPELVEYYLSKLDQES
ncbi:DUF2161 family putative PD-(D/E)XK-type phosphodiesterase [Mesobacillus jeotgali]|uniref:DUF2161 family putative PD-(D/E)XK-type phosphodiesterase n=1 Tax=Mesobacillus jeotgali TaxID=129985 RepID=A0ABY9VTC5_9BACI|nr:DUF2161 family putative PD-(D/E)XK-type phosphodiesterase [Mesobacillus jeotgali]WNF25022.1 DUF2161 family putative PD-(D/E)XK-type phosphodiesterase [Mesobacillus jeotgali]